MRILNIVSRMNRGGIETWLMHVLRNMDRERFYFDFLVHKNTPGDYDREIKKLGSRIYTISAPGSVYEYPEYLKNFRNILRENGPFDIIHAHGGPLYGPLLREAYKCHVPVRIIHSHSLQLLWRKGWLRDCAGFLGKIMIRRYATLGLGNSLFSCHALFGPCRRQNPEVKVLYYGIDTSPYQVVERDAIRKQLQIGDKEIVVGHVGRFCLVKNHRFIVEIANKMLEKNKHYRFLLIGDGPEKRNIEQLIEQYHLGDYFILTGLRSDIPQLLSAMDLFVFPSFHEGLPLSLVEAQAIGLRCAVSSAVSKEIDIVPGLCRFFDLKKGAQAWANLLESLVVLPGIKKTETLDIVEQSHFNINHCVDSLQKIYLGAVREA